jgi:hypothetical protein
MEKKGPDRSRRSGRDRIYLDRHQHHLPRYPSSLQDSRGHEGPERPRQLCVASHHDPLGNIAQCLVEFRLVSRRCRAAIHAVGLSNNRDRKSPAVSNVSFRRYPIIIAPSGQRCHSERRGICLYLITAER